MRRRRWTRRIGAVFGTLAVGGLLGFLIPTIAAEYAPAPAPSTSATSTSALPVSMSASEIPMARQFINAFVANDQARLRALGADEVDTVKANDLAAQVIEIDPPVLLGSVGGPGASVQAYASHVRLNDGTAKI